MGKPFITDAGRVTLSAVGSNAIRQSAFPRAGGNDMGE